MDNNLTLAREAEANDRVAAEYRRKARNAETQARYWRSRAERHEALAEKLRAQATAFEVGEVCCIDYTKLDGDKRFYWNVKVSGIYANGDVGIVWLDEDRKSRYRRLSIVRCERVNY